MNDFLDSAVDLPEIDLAPITDGMTYVAEPDAKSLAIKFGILGTGQGGCIAGCTNIYVSERGILQIQEFFNEMLEYADISDIIVTGGDVGIRLNNVYTVGIDAESGQPVRAKVSAVWKNKAKIHKKIVFSNKSELFCSASHPTFVFRPNSRNKIFSQSTLDSNPLQVNDRVLDSRNLILDVSEEQDMVFRGVRIDSDIGWLLGLFAGDGSAKSKENGNSITFHLSDDFVLNKAKAILSKLPISNTISVTDQKGCKRLSVSGLQASLFFKSAFQYDGGKKAYTLRIPRCCLHHPHQPV
jgi:hypothetical protein